MRRLSSIIVLLAGLALVSCRNGSDRGAPSPMPGSPLASDRSIYALEMTLTDQDGAKVGLDVFRGKPVFVGMFYGRCPSACPILISTIKSTLAQLAPPAAAEVRVLLVSFDPEHDTSDALHAIAQQRGLDSRWKLTNAPEDQVRDLAELLGIRYRRLPDGSFSHTSSIVLLDRSGAIDTRLDDVSQSVEPLAARARAIAAAE